MGALVLAYLFKEDGCCSCTREPQVVNRDIFEMKNNEIILEKSQYLSVSNNEDIKTNFMIIEKTILNF